jgi:hypothetical protein
MPINFRFEGNRPLLRELNADRLNQLVVELQRTKPLPGRGISYRQEAGGVRLDVLGSQAGSTGIGRRRTPFHIYVTEKNEDEYKVRVTPGLVGGLLCENWDEEFTLDAGSLYYGAIEVTTDGTYLTGASMSFETEPPQTQTPEVYSVPSSVFLLFGLFKDRKSYNLANGNISASSEIVFVGAKESAQPGQSPYDLYYAIK